MVICSATKAGAVSGDSCQVYLGTWGDSQGTSPHVGSDLQLDKVLVKIYISIYNSNIFLFFLEYPITAAQVLA